MSHDDRLDPLQDAWSSEDTQRQRRMFEQAPGFICTLRGPEHVFDFVNNAHRRLFGERDYVGKSVRKAFPELADQGFYELLDRVYATGERHVASGAPARIRTPEGREEERFLDFIYEPMTDEAGEVVGVFCEGYDVTDRTLAERALRATSEREHFLVALGDSLRSMVDPRSIVAATTKALGEHLNVARVVYADIDPDLRTATTEGDWTDGEAEHLPDRVNVGDFSPTLIAALQTGATLVVEDTGQHPATRDSLAALDRIGARALISVPLVKEGRFAGNLNVHSREPRRWTRAEVELAEAVAERTWDVLARAWAVAAAAERERELQTLTDTLPVLISYVDSERRYRFINKVYEDWFPAKREDILGRPVREVVGEAAYAIVAPYMDRVLAGERLRIEQLLPYTGAGARHVEVEYVPREGPDGRVSGFYALVQDVSERIEAQAALRASEARLRFLDQLGASTAPLIDADAILSTTTRLLGEHLRVSICAYADMDEDQDGFTIRGDWAAPGSTSIVGRYSLAAFGRMAVTKLRAGEPLIVADNLQELAPEEAATFQSIGISATICMPLVKEGRLAALMAIHDRVPRVWTSEELNLLREVTARSWAHVERVGAQEELRASEARLRELNADLERQVVERTQARGRTWQLSPDLMGALNSEGYFETSNPAWEAVLGWSEAEVARTSIWELLHPEDLEQTRDGLRLTRLGQGVIDFASRYRCKDGRYRWISWVGVPDGELVYCTGRDVTDEKARQAALAQAQEALRQSQKMEAVGQLTGGVAHDFNNLLTVIRGSVELLLRPDQSEEKRRRYIAAIADTSERATKLTSQLLAFARRQALRPEVFDVGAAVDAVGEMVRTLAGSRIAVTTRLPVQALFVNADPSQFDTAIVNMAANARDAMSGEGEITIAVEAVEGVPGGRVQGVSAGRFVAVSISDTGSGIPEDQLEQIFEPFFTTKSVGKGTGLGLSQVFGFAKQSEGEVVVRSVPGQGSTFTLYLPEASPPKMASLAEDTPSPSVHGRGACVLVVEDNAEVGRFALSALEELGFTTVLAETGERALALLSENPDRFQVVFSDVVMPGMSGVELAREIGRKHPTTPVVLASGYSHVLAQNGAHGFELLQKPYSVDELSRVLLKSLG